MNTLLNNEVQSLRNRMGTVVDYMESNDQMSNWDTSVRNVFVEVDQILTNVQFSMSNCPNVLNHVAWYAGTMVDELDQEGVVSDWDNRVRELLLDAISIIDNNLR